MPILDWDPGQSPEAPGTLSFFKQGFDPSSGFQASADGVVNAPGGWNTAAATLSGALTVGGFTSLASAQTSGDLTVYGSSLTLGTAGGGLRVKEGANASMGVVALTAGGATVNTTKVTANSRIFLTVQVPGGSVGSPRIASRVAGTSFTIASSQGTDTSTVAWWIVEPAP